MTARCAGTGHHSERFWDAGNGRVTKYPYTGWKTAHSAVLSRFHTVWAKTRNQVGGSFRRRVGYSTDTEGITIRGGTLTFTPNYPFSNEKR